MCEDCTDQCSKLPLTKLRGLLKKGGISHLVHLSPVQSTVCSTALSDSVQQIIQNNNNLFQEPKDLPPCRDRDHGISLLPGVKPVNIKPYRYSPTQKDEI